MSKLVIIIFVLFFVPLGFSQQKLTETEKLAATCKVWGFLKYYHPNVANGEKDWNKQLFTILSEVEKVNYKSDFSNLMKKWIDTLGTIKKEQPIKESDTIVYFYKNLDLSWINTNKLCESRVKISNL